MYALLQALLSMHFLGKGPCLLMFVQFRFVGHGDDTIYAVVPAWLLES